MHVHILQEKPTRLTGRKTQTAHLDSETFHVGEMINWGWEQACGHVGAMSPAGEFFDMEESMLPLLDDVLPASVDIASAIAPLSVPLRAASWSAAGPAVAAPDVAAIALGGSGGMGSYA